VEVAAEPVDAGDVVGAADAVGVGDEVGAAGAADVEEWGKTAPSKVDAGVLARAVVVQGVLGELAPASAALASDEIYA